MPFDFSDASINAFNYIIDMIEESVELHILHVSSGLMTSGQFSQIGASNDLYNVEDEIETIICKNLGVQNLPEFINTNVAYGDIVSSIGNYAKKMEIDEIIMATKDNYDLFDRWLGTVSFGVIKTSKIPVRLIPPNSTYNSLTNILVALDEDMDVNSQLDFLGSWNKELGAKMSFIHIKDSADDNFDLIKEQIVNKYFESNDAQFSFEIIESEQSNIAQGIINYAENENMDLVCVFPRSQALLETIFFKSISKSLILSTKSPLYFIPKSVTYTGSRSDKLVNSKSI